MILVTDKDHDKPTLVCNTAAEVMFMQGDLVTATGTVANDFDQPSLADCTVTKK